MKITLGQLIGILVLIIIVGAGAYVGTSKLKKKNAVNGGKTRQAVFLTNNQVYFGFVSNSEAKTVTLKDIYYLQVNQNPQTGDKSQDEQQQLSLVKLGQELHGPKDQMRINRDHILFIEDMKDDAKVNAAISDYIKNGGTTATPSPSPAP